MSPYLLITLRFVHIIAGVLWAGAAVIYLFFIKPSVKAIGPSGPQFMQNLIERRKYPIFMQIVSLLTVICGGILFFYISGKFSTAWMKSGVGLGFTIGSLAALGAFLAGSLGVGPISVRMGALGQQIGKNGGKPTPEQGLMMQSLEKKLVIFEQIDFILLCISLVTMATARYWFF